jgi:hypothetical protein
MPKRVNPIHTQILGALIEGTNTTRTRRVLQYVLELGRTEVVDHPGHPAGFALRYPLAQNVSDRSVEIMSRRWM